MCTSVCRQELLFVMLCACGLVLGCGCKISILKSRLLAVWNVKSVSCHPSIKGQQLPKSVRFRHTTRQHHKPHVTHFSFATPQPFAFLKHTQHFPPWHTYNQLEHTERYTPPRTDWWSVFLPAGCNRCVWGVRSSKLIQPWGPTPSTLSCQNIPSLTAILHLLKGNFQSVHRSIHPGLRIWGSKAN